MASKTARPIYPMQTAILKCKNGECRSYIPFVGQKCFKVSSNQSTEQSKMIANAAHSVCIRNCQRRGGYEGCHSDCDAKHSSAVEQPTMIARPDTAGLLTAAISTSKPMRVAPPKDALPQAISVRRHARRQ